MRGSWPLLLLLMAVLLAGCGKDGAPATPTPTAISTVAANDPGPEPRLAAPASQYSLLHEDVGPGYLTDVRATFTLDAASYARTRAFDSAEEGEKSLAAWGYRDGYETGYIPEGYEFAVLRGRFYIQMELHLFEGAEGAKQAFAYFVRRVDASGAERVSAAQVGNESVAWVLVEGNVPSSTVPAVFHRVVFRRGNLVAVVATWGAQPLMTVEEVSRLARMVDEKALGTRPPVVPTPLGATPTPAGAGR